MSAGIELWQYTDERGTLVVVDALEKVPPGQRDKAAKVVLEKKATGSAAGERPALTTQVARELAEIHWTSFGAGVAVALGVVLVARVVWSGAKMLLKVAAFVAVAALLVGGYFGVIRQQAGLGAGPVSPQELVQDAQRAAEQAKKMIDKQERELRKIEDR